MLLLLVFYLFAILAMILFRDNDPWHFGSLHISMLTLFRCATLEDWTEVMCINMYGCDKFGYDGHSIHGCTAPNALGWWAAAYFVGFIFIASMVMLTLFVGVITTSMDQAKAQLELVRKLDLSVKKLIAEHNLPPRRLREYKQIFKVFDCDGGGTIEMEELGLALRTMGEKPTVFTMMEMGNAVDSDGDGIIDFAEFAAFLTFISEKKEIEKEDDKKKTPNKLMRRASNRVMNANKNADKRVMNGVISGFDMKAHSMKFLKLAAGIHGFDAQETKQMLVTRLMDSPSQMTGVLSPTRGDNAMETPSDSQNACIEELLAMSSTEREDKDAPEPFVYDSDSSLLSDTSTDSSSDSD